MFERRCVGDSLNNRGERKKQPLHIRDLIAGEKDENISGEFNDTQDRAPILEAMQTYLRAEPGGSRRRCYHRIRPAFHASSPANVLLTRRFAICKSAWNWARFHLTPAI